MRGGGGDGQECWGGRGMDMNAGGQECWGGGGGEWTIML